MKKLVLSLYFLSHIIPSTSYAKKNELPLESSILQVVDGSNMGIDGDAIGALINTRRNIRNFLYGVSSPSSCPKIYLFEGKSYCVADLAVLFQEKVELNTKQEIKKILEQAKVDFLAVIQDFLEQDAETKDRIISPLVDQWAQKFNKKESIILNWAHNNNLKHTKEDVMMQFNKDINTFERLSTFCKDLLDFMEKFIMSCPKALEQLKTKRKIH